MKTLQNNFTTPEQSKRLLELGLPEDSADCYLELYDSELDVMVRNPIISKAWFFDENKDILPCWSLGRLIEIYLICNLDKETDRFVIYKRNFGYPEKETDISNPIDYIIKTFEPVDGIKWFDFLKLEK